MGIAASLFHCTSDPKQTLDWRIRPSDEQFEQQKERWNDLAAHLLDDLATRSGHPISSWLQGSYKFGTQVRPPSALEEFDIDLGIYFRWEGGPEDGEHDPDELKGFVRLSLLDYADDEENDATSVADPKPRCERIHFKPDFHIDVPCYHLDPAADERALATEDGDWEDSDPKAIYKWWKDTFADNVRPRLRRLVRYMKMWAALNFKEGRPSSIMLTVLVGEAWQAMDSETPSGDDEYLVEVVRTIVDRIDGSTVVPNPAATWEDLNRLENAECEVFLGKLRELLDTGERALQAVTRTSAADIWSDAFQHFFPYPDEDEEEEEALLKEASRALVPVRFAPNVAVVARPKGQPHRTFTGTNSIGPIPKDCEITFTLVNAAQLPAGATLSWTVRNQGDEAEDENDLGHLSGSDLEVVEHSAYRGTHSMDLAVRLRGRTIGRQRIPVRVTNMKLPPRNAARPSWVNLRGRK
jgi:hypothetical protein